MGTSARRSLRRYAVGTLVAGMLFIAGLFSRQHVCEAPHRYTAVWKALVTKMLPWARALPPGTAAPAPCMLQRLDLPLPDHRVKGHKHRTGDKPVHVGGRSGFFTCHSRRERSISTFAGPSGQKPAFLSTSGGPAHLRHCGSRSHPFFEPPWCASPHITTRGLSNTISTLRRRFVSARAALWPEACLTASVLPP